MEMPPSAIQLLGEHGNQKISQQDGAVPRVPERSLSTCYKKDPLMSREIAAVDNKFLPEKKWFYLNTEDFCNLEKVEELKRACKEGYAVFVRSTSGPACFLQQKVDIEKKAMSDLLLFIKFCEDLSDQELLKRIEKLECPFYNKDVPSYKSKEPEIMDDLFSKLPNLKELTIHYTWTNTVNITSLKKLEKLHLDAVEPRCVKIISHADPERFEPESCQLKVLTYNTTLGLPEIACQQLRTYQEQLINAKGCHKTIFL